jgi:hypothetical protein
VSFTNDPLMEGGTEYDLEHLKIKAVELASASMSFIDYIRNGDNKRALGQMLVLEALASDIMNENY